MRGLKSDQIVGVGGMHILYEERRLYGAESEINTRVFWTDFGRLPWSWWKTKETQEIM